MQQPVAHPPKRRVYPRSRSASHFSHQTAVGVSSLNEFRPELQIVWVVPHGNSLRGSLLAMKAVASTSRISSQTAALFLMNPDSFRYFEPFLAQSSTVSAVALALNVEVSSVLYRIKQMRALGLLTVSKTKPRAGRAIRHYRSASDEFFVPFALTSVDTLRSMSAQLTTEFQRSFDHAFGATLEQSEVADDLGVRIWRNPDGHTSRDLMPTAQASGDTTLSAWLLEPGMPAFWNQHAWLRLSDADGKALQLELGRVWQMFSGKEDERGRLYALRLGLTALE